MSSKAAFVAPPPGRSRIKAAGLRDPLTRQRRPREAGNKRLQPEGAPALSVILRRFWALASIPCVVVSIIAAPVEIGLGLGGSCALWRLNDLLDAFFIMDVAVNCFGAPRATAARYLRGWFAVDALASLPWDALFVLLAPHASPGRCGAVLYDDGWRRRRRLTAHEGVRLLRVLRACRAGRVAHSLLGD